MVTIVICNKKGGVGKTTTAYTLSAMLTYRNKRVLALDLDGQKNLTKMAGVDQVGPTAYSVMMHEVPIEKAIIKTEWFSLIQGSSSLFTIGTAIPEGVDRVMRIRKAIRSVKDNYDYCIIDTAPAVDVVTVNALMAADYVVIPAEANELSTDGIVAINDRVNDIREYANKNLKIAGILLTRYRKQTNIARDYKEIFEAYAKKIGTKLFSTEIREAIVFSEIPSVHQPVFQYQGNSSGAEDYNAFVDELLGSIESEVKVEKERARQRAFYIERKEEISARKKAKYAERKAQREAEKKKAEDK